MGTTLGRAHIATSFRTECLMAPQRASANIDACHASSADCSVFGTTDQLRMLMTRAAGLPAWRLTCEPHRAAHSVPVALQVPIINKPVEIVHVISQ